jgi:hypothetical protein
VEKLRVKQQSRLNYIKAAEARSKLFHLYLNGRRRKNYMQTLSTPVGLVHSHEDKERHIFKHFSAQFGAPAPRDASLDWQRVGLPRLQLEPLDSEFSEEEVLAVVTEMAMNSQGRMVTLGRSSGQLGRYWLWCATSTSNMISI